MCQSLDIGPDRLYCDKWRKSSPVTLTLMLQYVQVSSALNDYFLRYHDRLTDRHQDRQTDRQRHRHTDTQTDMSTLWLQLINHNYKKLAKSLSLFVFSALERMTVFEKFI